jgi:hydrogenase maturation protein HypF
MAGERIRIRGLVQGVGFRPMVWRVARAAGVRGHVINDGEGVLVSAWGDQGKLDRLCAQIVAQCPPLARIDSMEREVTDASVPENAAFEIQASRPTAIHTGIVADAATCPDCLAEVFDPDDRRSRYPFTNCTHCGPRLSIVRGIPYDRANTSMAAFRQCPQCQAEYDDPANRRFHAQPNACPECGPRVWLEDASGRELPPSDQGAQDAIALAVALLAQGHIVAIKGIGGFHLACDAADPDTVATLRRRKRRDDKPFALMAAGIPDVERFVRLGDRERELLASTAAPVVLAERRHDGPALAEQLAPNQGMLGFMLPYSPLHHVLLDDWQRTRPGYPLVMTSGNRSDEPQCTDNRDAGSRLHEIADYWLLHDREIVNRVDDSVVRVDAGRERLIRRARGYAPTPLPLPPGLERVPALLALGAELKNTFCLIRDGQAIVSQHIGDLEDARTSDAWERSLALYRDLYQHKPQALVVDLHPDYRCTRFGHDWAGRDGLELHAVQHHHAHIASVMADSGRPLDAGPVLGIALDGLGMGSDGTLWGGEFLRADYQGFERLAHLQPVPLPGGTRALLEPWRNTWAHLSTQIGWEQVCQRWPSLELTSWLQTRPLETFEQMLHRGLNSPLSSSCGRLFDAVAAALGLRRERISYEGQAAIELEQLAREAGDESVGYPLEMQNGVIQVAPMWNALLDDLAAGVDKARIAARFHNGLAAAICGCAGQLCAEQSLGTVALSGGVFQNRTLFAAVQQGLEDRQLQVLSHSRVPSNDGGIALGQALIGAARMLQATAD